jgi:hypothetical protein
MNPSIEKPSARSEKTSQSGKKGNYRLFDVNPSQQMHGKNHLSGPRAAFSDSPICKGMKP